ncbi:MAG: anti-sigma factor antagonist [Oscillospiraceae bacterium]|nr:anti-sigma factor antagonist [Oscillospiraceae bacterium]
MELFLSGKHHTLIVRIYGELDHHAAIGIRESVDRELSRTGARNVAFDLSRVTFMDSSGIGVIMGRYKVTKALGGRVILYGANEDVKRLINMSGIGNIAVIADNEEAGMREVEANV